MSALYGLIGAGMGIFNNLFAQRSAEATAERNYEYSEMAAQNADTRTRQLYKDIYSPTALLKEYKKAGLSPSLMFGGTPGQGGLAGAQGSGTAGQPSPYMPISLLEGAQLKQILAETEKTKAETKQIEPVAKATVSSLLAETGYKDAAAKAARAQAAGIELDNYVKNNTKEASIYTICELSEKAAHEATKALHEMRSAKIAADFDEQTFEDRKQIMTEQLNQIVQSICESKSVERLNERQRSYLRSAMLEAIDNTNREWAKYDLTVDQFETFLDKQIPILEKEIEIKLKDLDIQNKRLIVEGITNSVRAIMSGVAAASLSSKLGKGGNMSPTANQVLGTPKGGNAINKGVPIYKNNSVWSY